MRPSARTLGVASLLTALGLAALAPARAWAAPRPAAPASATAEVRAAEAARPAADLLRATVHGGRVDYAALRARRADLDAAIAGLAGADTAGWTPARRAMLQVDLYNLVMIRAVLDRWKPGWTPQADDFAVFRAPLVPTRAGPISLDELEKRRTLEAFEDPRLHLAFNCGATSCPVLRPGAGSDDPADALDRALGEFLSDSTRNQVDHAGRTLRLSRIFDWYAADFGGREGVLKMVSRHLGRDVSGYRVEFQDYDWSLNALTYPDGSRPR